MNFRTSSYWKFPLFCPCHVRDEKQIPITAGRAGWHYRWFLGFWFLCVCACACVCVCVCCKATLQIIIFRQQETIIFAYASQCMTTVPPLLPVDVVYCGFMWVKKRSALYLSPQNLDFTFHSVYHPSLLPSSLLSTNLHLSALLSLQVLLCPTRTETDPTEQIVRNSSETQNMAVAGCPDYFLHHPNYQVNGSFLCRVFFIELNYVSKQDVFSAKNCFKKLY